METVGARVRRIVAELEALGEETGFEFFITQARFWSQWLWMLSDERKREWGLELHVGHGRSSRN